MIQRKKKRILWITIIVAILVAIAGGSICFINTKHEETAIQQTEKLNFNTKSLILKTKSEIGNTYNAINIEELMENMYVLEYETEEAAKNAYEQLKNSEEIEYVTPDGEYKLNNNITEKIIYYQNGSGEVFTSWAPTAMGLDVMQNKLNNKEQLESIQIAVIDSGLDLEHPIITEKFSSMISPNYYNAIDKSTDITDENGHGTMMTSAILDCAPNNAIILPIKIMDSEGKTEGQYLIRGINYAIEQNVDIINLSLGSEPGSATEAGKLAIQEAVQGAIDAGIIVVAAAGNGNSEGIGYNMDIAGNEVYPAAIPDVITIGSLKNELIQLDQNGMITNNYDEYKNPTEGDLSISEFSNYGSVIDFVTPGEYIIGLAPTNLADTGIVISSGTSQATAHMSAAIANILSYNKNLTNEQVYEILEYYAQDLGNTGKDVYYGNGFIDLKNVQECTCNCEDCDEIYCFGCTCTDCIYHEQEEKTLERIEITTKPTKLEYTEGEKFSPAGMVITAVYSDNSKEIVTNYTYAPTGELSTTDTKIIITYEEKTVELPITVNEKQEEPPVPEKTLERIEITTKPNKLIYTEGETFNPSGMVVKAVYSDNSKEIVTNYTYAPTGNLSTSNTKITVTYEGKTAEISITVNSKQVEQPEITLKRIEITALPNKTTYKEGEKFDKTGMVVKAIYSDGTSKVINNYNCFPITELTTSNKKITVSYTENGISVSTTIDIVVNTENTNNNGNNNNNNNNNSNNPNNNNSNNQNNNNNGTTNGNTTSKDNTVKDQDLAFTGVETYIIPAVIIIIIGGTIAFIKYRQYKDI